MKSLNGVIDLLKLNEYLEDDLFSVLEPECTDILDMLQTDGYGIYKSLYKDAASYDAATMKVLGNLTAYFIIHHINNSDDNMQTTDVHFLQGTSEIINIGVGLPVDGLSYVPELFAIEVDTRTGGVVTTVSRYDGPSWCTAQIASETCDLHKMIKNSFGVKTVENDNNIIISDKIIKEVIYNHNLILNYAHYITRGSKDAFARSTGDYKYAGTKLKSEIRCELGNIDIMHMSIDEIKDAVDKSTMLSSICKLEMPAGDGDYTYVRDRCILEMLIGYGRQDLNLLFEDVYGVSAF